MSRKNDPRGKSSTAAGVAGRPGLAALRASLDRALGSGRIRTGDEVERAPISRVPLESFVPGRRIAMSAGETFLSETLYAPSHRHGVLAVEALGNLPCPDSASLFPDTLGRAARPEEIAFLDTETTGMAGVPSTAAFLVGIARYRPHEGLRVEQFFLEDRGGEPALLDAVADALADSRVLVTYNGATFDLPILESRYALHGRSDPLAALPHLDLLPPSRSLWRCTAPNCRLLTLERLVLGFERVGDVAGAEIPRVYERYLRHGAPSRLSAVFTHNALDLLSLAGLLWAAGEIQGGRWNGPGSGAGIGPRPSRRGPSSEAKILKERLRRQRAEGDWDGALETARKLRAATGGADPFAVEEEAKVLERRLGRPDDALNVLEDALAEGIWHPADRAKLEKRLERLRSKRRK